MGISAGPQIIRDSSLVLGLDASDANSNYRSNGRIWNDLSGNNNTGSIVNGATLNNDGYGSFVFNGINSYIALPINFFNPDSGSSFTVSFWFKTTTAGIILGQQNTLPPTNATGYVPAIYVDSAGKIRTSCFWGGATNNQSVSALTVTDNAWHNVAVTFSSGSHISYVDGNSFATLAKTQTNYDPTYYYLIGTGAWGGWTSTTGNTFFSGSVANMLFYNQALTSTQIQSNYIQVKSRFDSVTPNIITYTSFNQATAITVFNDDIEFSNILIGTPSPLANAVATSNSPSL
jgi:hypothetical protein